MIPRLFTSSPLAAGAILQLDAAATHHASRVLRLTVGDAVELFDGNGHGASASLVAPASGTVRVERLLPAEPLPALRLVLAQCVSSADRMDWTIEKAVELGVAELVPLQSQKALVKLAPPRIVKRHEHWQRVIVAACAQSGRKRVPHLHPVSSLGAWLRELPAASPESSPPGLPENRLRIVLAPGADRSLGEVLAAAETAPDREAASGRPACDQVWLLCGPEAGLTEGEVQQACDAGWLPAGLGPRILRTETAGLVALAVLQARWGDLR
jgi:16S rRNA (uracil1498-N3)-methyltransferase